MLRNKKVVDISILQAYLVFTEREEIPPLNQPSSVTGCEIFDKEAESRAAARRAYVVYLLHCMRERGRAREPLHIEKGAGESWGAAARQRRTIMSTTAILTDESFESILVRITKTQGEKRKLICQAFRASLADIMNSKSTQKVNAFVRVASALPEWAKIKKAIFIFAGGFKYHSSAKAVERYYDETLSVVSYNAKEKAFYMRDGLTPEAFAVATSQYHGIMAFDYDAVSVKAEPRATMDLAPLLKALERQRTTGTCFPLWTVRRLSKYGTPLARHCHISSADGNLRHRTYYPRPPPLTARQQTPCLPSPFASVRKTTASNLNSAAAYHDSPALEQHLHRLRVW